MALAHVRADISFAIIDAFMVVVAYVAALSLRLLDPGTGDIRTFFTVGLVRVLPLIVFTHLICNIALGAYGHTWEFASMAEAKRVVLANLVASGMIFLYILLAQDPNQRFRLIPLSSVVLGGLITLSGMGLIRFRSRLFSFRRAEQSDHGQRVLVVGSGGTVVPVVRYLREGPERAEIVGIVAETNPKSSRRLAGLPLLGRVHDVAALVERHGITQVVVAGGSSVVARQVLDQCLINRVRLRIVPDLGGVLSSSRPTMDIRDLELTDLLARPAVATDLSSVETLLQGRRVLVTGAGGSIGREIVRQVLRFSPSLVVAMDHDETHLHDAVATWEVGEPTHLVESLADVRDQESVLRVFQANRPEVVFHAAALKHVPILEAHPDEAVKTNVIGTDNLISACRRYEVESFVLISTDKAVSPVNAMGASKRVAEMLVQNASRRAESCRYTAVRFGNVLGSRGSVVPTFIRQISAGGPVTVTDPAMTRYFMTVDEAVQLVLQAAALAKGGEVFVLDMGEQVRIIELAHRLIRLAGLVPGEDVEVRITGPRPGEKLVETLSLDPLSTTEHPQIMVAHPSVPGPVTALDSVSTLGHLAADGDQEAVRQMLVSLTARTWSEDEVISLEEMPSSVGLIG